MGVEVNYDQCSVFPDINLLICTATRGLLPRCRPPAGMVQSRQMVAKKTNTAAS